MAKAASDNYQEHRDNAHVEWYRGICQQTGEPKPSEHLQPPPIEEFKASLADWRARRAAKPAPAKAEQS